MRKTYFLLLLSVIMSWQFVIAIVIQESMWSFSSYVSAPKLKEIVTKLDNFVEEKTDNEAVVSNLNDSKNSTMIRHAYNLQLNQTQYLRQA